MELKAGADKDVTDLKGNKMLSTEAKNILSDLELDSEDESGKFQLSLLGSSKSPKSSMPVQNSNVTVLQCIYVLPLCRNFSFFFSDKEIKRPGVESKPKQTTRVAKPSAQSKRKRPLHPQPLGLL